MKCNKAYGVAKYKLTGFKNWEFPEINDGTNKDNIRILTLKQQKSVIKV